MPATALAPRRGPRLTTPYVAPFLSKRCQLMLLVVGRRGILLDLCEIRGPEVDADEQIVNEEVPISLLDFGVHAAPWRTPDGASVLLGIGHQHQLLCAFSVGQESDLPAARVVVAEALDRIRNDDALWEAYTDDDFDEEDYTACAEWNA